MKKCWLSEFFSIAELGLKKCCMWAWRHLPGHCCPWVVFGVLPPLARKFNGFMTSFWFLYEKMLTQANFFSIAGLGLKKCCMWAWRHLPGALLPRSSFWCFAPFGSYILRFHDKFLIFVFMAIFWRNFYMKIWCFTFFLMKISFLYDLANVFSIAGLRLKKCCMWAWRHLPVTLLPMSSFWCLPPLARKFNSFMASFWFLWEKMLTQRIFSR